MLDIGGFLTSPEVVTQIAALFSAIFTALFTSLILPLLGGA
jgi:hypothetical protein